MSLNRLQLDKNDWKKMDVYRFLGNRVRSHSCATAGGNMKLFMRFLIQQSGRTIWLHARSVWYISLIYRKQETSLIQNYV